MIILGVTGSIGSGKSYFCKKFSAKKGVKYISSDEMVHELYAHNNQVLEFVRHNFAASIIENKIDRKVLGNIVFNDKEKLKKLQSFIHPLLKKQRRNLIARHRANGTKIIVLEIPLLFENNLQSECDFTLTIFCSRVIEEQRASKRFGFTREKFLKILSSQMNVQKKIMLSDYSINSGSSYSTIRNKIYQDLISTPQ